MLNSVSITEMQRRVGASATGEQIGFAPIYDRIAWLEEVFPAYKARDAPPLTWEGGADNL